jgi:hypothetical protein
MHYRFGMFGPRSALAAGSFLCPPSAGPFWGIALKVIETGPPHSLASALFSAQMLHDLRLSSHTDRNSVLSGISGQVTVAPMVYRKYNPADLVVIPVYVSFRWR